MKFKKIYIEITNACNFNCSFCYPSKRAKWALTVDEFRFICEKIRPFTAYIYLHVMGEPLLHPQLEEILCIANQYDFQVNITTNGSLVGKQQAVLQKYPPRQINVSLHDLEENVEAARLPALLQELICFADSMADTTYLNFRLWNRLEGEPIGAFSQRCLDLLQDYLSIDDAVFTSENFLKGIHLRKHIYLQSAPRFSWPDTGAEPLAVGVPKTCYALKDHIAILSDGSIVPCCLDADAHLRLGNIFTDDLGEVLHTKKALLIKEGFANKVAIENFCRVCGFR
jgi:radical SAM protein with 4Fe4S-binding SPASM domain